MSTNIPEIPEWDESVSNVIERALEMAEKFPSLFREDPATVRKMIAKADLFERQLTLGLEQIEEAEKAIAGRRELYTKTILQLGMLREKLNGRGHAN